jgi:hypothetical protein
MLMRGLILDYFYALPTEKEKKNHPLKFLFYQQMHLLLNI